VPSPLPSPLPTQVPTLFTCSYTDDGDFDPTAYLALAKPEIAVSAGSAFALAAEASQGTRANAVFLREFGLLSGSAAPGSAFSFTATVADGVEIATGGAAGTTQAEAPLRVEVVLKTATLYHDDPTLEVAYQLFDAAGRTAVSARAPCADTLSLSLSLARARTWQRVAVAPLFAWFLRFLRFLQ
jgi:hypothetical protein